MPPLTVMSLSARSIVNHQDNKKEIVGTSARVWQDSKRDVEKFQLAQTPTDHLNCTVNIDDPTPIEKQPCSLHTAVRPLLDKFPAGFEHLARTQKNKILTAKTERQLLNHLLSTPVQSG